MQPTERFAEVVGGPEPDVRLEEAALLIAAHAFPGLSVDAELARLDDLAAGVGAPTLDGLVRHLFDDLGFRGNRSAYYDPRNSFLNVVLDRRTGIPISLAVMTLAVGRRVGVPLAPVGMPGHFLLRDKVDPGVFVDPFAGGALLDRSGCEAAFRSVQGADALFDPAYLEPVGAYAVVARMLANLRAVYAAAADREALCWVLRLRSLVPGVPLDERAQLAAALAAVGRFRDAAAEYDVLAEGLGGALAGQYERSAARLRARLN